MGRIEAEKSCSSEFLKLGKWRRCVWVQLFGHVRSLPFRVCAGGPISTRSLGSDTARAPTVISSRHDNKLSDFCLILAAMPEIAESKVSWRQDHLWSPGMVLTDKSPSRPDCPLPAHPPGRQDDQGCKGDRRCQCVWQGRHHRTSGCGRLDGEEGALGWDTGQILLVRGLTLRGARAWQLTFPGQRLVLDKPPHPVMHFGMTGRCLPRPRSATRPAEH